MVQGKPDSEHSTAAAGRVDVPIPVLFIGGAGRSGSTLLDRVVGMQGGFCSVGEGHFVWERSFQQNQLCGCGQPFHECGFWEEVTRTAFAQGTSEFDAVSAVRLKQAIDRKHTLNWLLLGRGPSDFSRRLSAYGQLIERLYQAVLNISGQRVIVDSSKDARHGLVLSRLPGVELHVIHLIRDPRAVAFSWKRLRRRPEIHWKAEDMPVESVYTSSGRWLTQNLLVEMLSRSAQSYTRFRYEDFVADPGATLARLLSPIDGIDPASLSLDSESLELEPAHTVSGNPMRFKQGRVRITMDSEWREAMPATDRWLVDGITLPLLTRYGYSLRADARD
jgi:hypothetical protein